VNFQNGTGGVNWSNPSFNPQLGYLFVNLTNDGSIKVVRPEGSTGAGATRGRLGPTFVMGGLPCWQPPWGEMVAVNVNTGEIAWRTPLGITESLGEKGLKTGAWNLGGNISTAGGLVFVAATNDRRFRAFDAKNGAELWTVELPASGHATPITYMGRDGKQYVVVAAGGGTAIDRGRLSDALVAFSLP